MKTIPLSKGHAYQVFRVSLGEHYLEFYLYWLTQFGYFCVDISESGNVIAQGRALHPGVNLLSGLNTDIGVIMLEGQSPTISTLGIDNKLKWYPYDVETIRT